MPGLARGLAVLLTLGPALLIVAACRPWSAPVGRKLNWFDVAAMFASVRRR